MRTLLFYAPALSLAAMALLFSGCAGWQVTHVPPGESLNVALARKAEFVRSSETAPTVGTLAGPIRAVEPELPGGSVVERVAEAYSRGEFCMSSGKNEEAIAAFEEAVTIDPAFTEAWQQLAMLYEKAGDSKKAMEAFRRAKKVAQH